MKQGIEWQVSNRELSQMLRDLGVSQESLFYWIYFADEWLLTWNEDPRCINWKKGKVSAFTVAELGEMLPEWVDTQYQSFRLRQIRHEKDGWNVHYHDSLADEANWLLGEQCCADTEADARAKMLIHLIENDLILVPSGM